MKREGGEERVMHICCQYQPTEDNDDDVDDDYDDDDDDDDGNDYDDDGF